jgi:hypothetical protein
MTALPSARILAIETSCAALLPPFALVKWYLLRYNIP